MSRFELENYKNVLLIDNLILISNTFYQSSDHFKYRTRNSKSDELRKINSVLEIEFHSIGNILTLKFIDGTRKLEFYSNERMMEFLKLINLDDMKLISEENLNLKTSIVSIIVPVFISIIIIIAVLNQYGFYGFLKYITLFVSFIIAMFLIIKKNLKSSIIKYKRN